MVKRAVGTHGLSTSEISAGAAVNRVSVGSAASFQRFT
jgi:hypothetical protein